MKKIMRGVLLFGMLGGMILACGNKSNNSNNSNNSTNSQAIKNEKVYKIGVSQIVDHPALNAAKQGFKDALAKAGIKADYDDKIANNEMSNQTLIMQQFSSDKKDLVYAITTPTAQAAKNQVDKNPCCVCFCDRSKECRISRNIKCYWNKWSSSSGRKFEIDERIISKS